MDRAYMYYNYNTPIYSSFSRTADGSWKALDDAHRELYYEGFERGDRDCIRLVKINYMPVKVFAKREGV